LFEEMSFGTPRREDLMATQLVATNADKSTIATLGRVRFSKRKNHRWKVAARHGPQCVVAWASGRAIRDNSFGNMTP
jgi:hypothetical protein